MAPGTALNEAGSAAAVWASAAGFISRLPAARPIATPALSDNRIVMALLMQSSLNKLARLAYNPEALACMNGAANPGFWNPPGPSSMPLLGTGFAGARFAFGPEKSRSRSGAFSGGPGDRPPTREMQFSLQLFFWL